MISRELHVVSTGKQSFHVLADIAAEIHPYIHRLHIREKQKTAREIYDGVLLLINRGFPLHKLVINDRLDVALTVKAAGVHLAFHSLDPLVVKRNFPTLKVGCSVHSLDEASAAKENGVDYLLYGHIYATNSKKGIPPRGLSELTRLCHERTKPVIAIGGIKPENVQEVLQAGASGVAVMSGILEADNPLHAVKDYYHKLIE